MLQLTQLIACVIGGLSQPFQNIYWISDEDSLFANIVRHTDVTRVLSSYSGHYVRHELGELRVGTTSIDEGDRLEEDLAAVADLAAGALAEILTRMADS